MSWKTLRRALPWLVLAGSFAVLCVFEWRNITDLLDSDMASDMIYANLLGEGRVASFPPTGTIPRSCGSLPTTCPSRPCFSSRRTGVWCGGWAACSPTRCSCSRCGPSAHSEPEALLPAGGGGHAAAPVGHVLSLFVRRHVHYMPILHPVLLAAGAYAGPERGGGPRPRVAAGAACGAVGGGGAVRPALHATFSALPLCLAALYLWARAGSAAAPRTRRLAWRLAALAGRDDRGRGGPQPAGALPPLYLRSYASPR